VSGLILDAGALIGFERNDRRIVVALARAVEREGQVVVPAGVVAQVWRDGSKQVRLARLLRSAAVEIEPLDDERARAAGQLCGAAGTRDVIDASVALCARKHGFTVMTGDVDDLRRLDPTLRLAAV
jgi:predicted nucleic acid-binding protein